MAETQRKEPPLTWSTGAYNLSLHQTKKPGTFCCLVSFFVGLPDAAALEIVTTSSGSHALLEIEVKDDPWGKSL